MVVKQLKEGKLNDPRRKKRERYVTTVQGRKRYVTRDLACLEFLQTIPMMNEEIIIQDAKSKYSSGMFMNSDENSKNSNDFEESLFIGENENDDSFFLKCVACFFSYILCFFLFRKTTNNKNIENSNLMEMRTHHNDDSDEDHDLSDIWERTPDELTKKTKKKKVKAQPLESPLLNHDVPSQHEGGEGEESKLLHQQSDLNSQQRRGRRLIGPETPDISMPSSIRLKLDIESAALRQWEKSTYHQPHMEKSRLFSSCSNSYPIITSSVIRFDPSEEENKRRRQKLIDQKAISVFITPKRDWRGLSYAMLLPEGILRLKKGIHDELLNSLMSEEINDYEPGVIDDPEMGQGKYSQMIRGDDTLGPMICSTLKFATSSDLKEELNNQWRERHPEQPSSLTLSKIRNLKAEALAGCVKINLEVTTVALACIYFERLVFQTLITKANRRLTMATCLVLAYKFNEPIFIGANQENNNNENNLNNGNNNNGNNIGNNNVIEKDPQLKLLFDFIAAEWSITPQQVQESEFGVLVKLKFRLHSKCAHIAHHFHRLLRWGFFNLSPREYLGDEDLFQSWSFIHLWKEANEPPLPITSFDTEKRQNQNTNDGSSESVKILKSRSPISRSGSNQGAHWWSRRKKKQSLKEKKVKNEETEEEEEEEEPDEMDEEDDKNEEEEVEEETKSEDEEELSDERVQAGLE